MVTEHGTIKAPVVHLFRSGRVDIDVLPYPLSISLPQLKSTFRRSCRSHGPWRERSELAASLTDRTGIRRRAGWRPYTVAKLSPVFSHHSSARHRRFVMQSNSCVGTQTTGIHRILHLSIGRDFVDEPGDRQSDGDSMRSRRSKQTRILNPDPNPRGVVRGIR